MSERLSFKERLNERIISLLGKRALLPVEGQFTSLDAELTLAYAGASDDKSSEQKIKSEYDFSTNRSRVESEEELQYRLDHGWELDESYSIDDGRFVNRVYPEVVVVDEYGIDTCLEPTRQQFEELADVTGDFATLLEADTAAKNYALAMEGEMAIRSGEFKDERVLKKLFAKQDEGLDTKDVLRRSVNSVAYPAYYADEVIVSGKEDYSRQQAKINQYGRPDVEAMK